MIKCIARIYVTFLTVRLQLARARWLTDSSLTGWITAAAHQRIENDAFITSHCEPRACRFHVDWYVEQQIGELVIDRVNFFGLKFFFRRELSREPYYEFNMIRETVQYITNFLHFFGIKSSSGDREKVLPRTTLNHQRFEPPPGDRRQIPALDPSLKQAEFNAFVTANAERLIIVGHISLAPRFVKRRHGTYSNNRLDLLFSTLFSTCKLFVTQ